jgi:hypothetical protein
MCSFLTISAQKIKQDVIASAGGSKVNGNLSISWTLGETIVPMFRSADNKLILTNGFLQQLIVTSVEEPIDIRVEVQVFPNPAGEKVNVRLAEPSDMKIQYSVVDAQGKPVKTGVIETGETEEQINLQNIPAGAYYLKLLKGKISNVCKILKY